jgi:hypothetical protein
MRKLFFITGAALLFCTTAGAWNYPQYETFLGYSFVRFNPNSDFIPSYNSNGGAGQFVYNFNRWFGGEIDAGAVNKGVLNVFNPLTGNIFNNGNIDTTTAWITAGPRVTFRGKGNDSRWKPFVHVLFGGAYTTASTPDFTSAFLNSRLVASQWNFAMFAGGGLDVRVSRHFWFRPVGADYFLTRFQNNIFGNTFGNGSTTTRNNFRYTAGLNFTWGEPK